MKYIKIIYTILIESIEIPLFCFGYVFESLWSSFEAGRTTYINQLMKEDEVNEFLKWREGKKIK